MTETVTFDSAIERWAREEAEHALAAASPIHREVRHGGGINTPDEEWLPACGAEQGSPGVSMPRAWELVGTHTPLPRVRDSARQSRRINRWAFSSSSLARFS